MLGVTGAQALFHDGDGLSMRWCLGYSVSNERGAASGTIPWCRGGIFPVRLRESSYVKGDSAIALISTGALAVGVTVVP